MKKLIVLLIAMYASHIVEGQNTETDSLKKLLPYAKEDLAHVTILEGLSYAYLSAYPDTALQYALKGLELAKRIQNSRGEAMCTNALGNVYFHVGDYAKALDMYLRALQMKEASKDQENIAVYYYNLSTVYTEQGDYPHALYYLFKTKQEDEKAKDSSGLMFDFYSLGSIYLRMKKADSALYYLQQGYELCERLEDKNMIGAILNTFGEIHLFLNEYPLAIQNYHSSIAYVEEIKDNEVLAANYYGLAKTFKQKGVKDSSVYYARKALVLAGEAPFPKQVLETSTFLADVFKTQKQYDSAYKYLALSVETKDSMFNVEEVKKVQNLKLQEQQRQQSLEVAKIKYRNKVKLNTAIAALSIFLVIAVVLWRNIKQKQKAYILLQDQKTKTDQALQELKTTQTQLIHQEKMASLGALTAGIAHEIQNPLNFVNNFSELNAELIDEMEREIIRGNIAEVKAIASNLKQNEQKIIHHGQRAEVIVKGMLQHSRTTTGHKEPTDINALADEYLRLSYHGLRAKDKDFTATIKTDFDKTLQKIDVVPEEIGRVLLNVFNNAYYAIKAKLQTSKKGETYEPTIILSTKKTNGKVVISVKDTGVGIPEKALNKIFQPFFTTKPTGQGTGLGLSISYDIIKAHHGELKVNSEEGKFSEFLIQLPAA